MVWPYFGTLSLTLETEESSFCQSFSAKGVEIKLALIVQSLDSNYLMKDKKLNFEQATFKLIFDYIPTPPRNKRLLID